MTFSRWFAWLPLISLLLLTACRSTQTTHPPEPASGTALTLTDASGTAVTLPRPAERIVCLHLSCIDILAELGNEDCINSKLSGIR